MTQFQPFTKGQDVEARLGGSGLHYRGKFHFMNADFLVLQGAQQGRYQHGTSEWKDQGPVQDVAVVRLTEENVRSITSFSEAKNEALVAEKAPAEVPKTVAAALSTDDLQSLEKMANSRPLKVRLGSDRKGAYVSIEASNGAEIMATINPGLTPKKAQETWEKIRYAILAGNITLIDELTDAPA